MNPFLENPRHLVRLKYKGHDGVIVHQKGQVTTAYFGISAGVIAGAYLMKDLPTLVADLRRDLDVIMMRQMIQLTKGGIATPDPNQTAIINDGYNIQTPDKRQLDLSFVTLYDFRVTSYGEKFTRYTALMLSSESDVFLIERLGSYPPILLRF